MLRLLYVRFFFHDDASLVTMVVMVLLMMALVMMVMLVLHNNAGTAFNTTVHFTDGSTTVFKRRERPHVVFSDPTRPSTPTHLTSVSSPRAIHV